MPLNFENPFILSVEFMHKEPLHQTLLKTEEQILREKIKDLEEENEALKKKLQEQEDKCNMLKIKALELEQELKNSEVSFEEKAEDLFKDLFTPNQLNIALKKI